ncbi:MAG: hypothetical protein CVU81_00895 [Euryarchaeota archaeon HGW-Euryarchaeota-1]|nr:MAG: hypothetical protein CVU81_00895 [Euryarchaeota archaeon HGW-Euryarchaeota-1]
MAKKDDENKEHERVIDIDLPVQRVSKQPKAEKMHFNADFSNDFNENIDFFGRGFSSNFSDIFKLLENLPMKMARQSGFEQMKIEEDADETRITVSLPGFEKKDINIKVQNDTLILSASKKSNNEIKNVSKQIYLGKGIEPKNMRAEYKNGLLVLIIRKKDNKSGGFDINIE